jgi:hypothetical protein
MTIATAGLRIMKNLNGGREAMRAMCKRTPKEHLKVHYQYASKIIL